MILNIEPGIYYYCRIENAMIWQLLKLNIRSFDESNTNFNLTGYEIELDFFDNKKFKKIEPFVHKYNKHSNKDVKTENNVTTFYHCDAFGENGDYDYYCKDKESLLNLIETKKRELNEDIEKSFGKSLKKINKLEKFNFD